jgi:hypothetical protein
LQFALASVIGLTRNFPNADIEMMKRIDFGKHKIAQASPITYVTPDDPPCLLIHGDQDELIPDAIFSPSLMEIYQIIVDFLAKYV